jgi:hypothetical protein
MSNKNNKWSVPETPPPLFTGQKERDFAKQVSNEIIEKIIGQPIAYYPVDLDRTNFHSLYGEAIKKTFLPPLRVYVLVEWEDPGSRAEDGFGVEKRTKLQLHFHKRRLTEDQNLFVREGDFIEYNQIYYEIVSLAEPRQLFGQGNHKLEVTANCVRARSGTFDSK